MTGDTARLAHGRTANQRINEDYRDYKRHLVEVVSADKELRKTLRDNEKLKKRYDDALREGLN